LLVATILDDKPWDSVTLHSILLLPLKAASFLYKHGLASLTLQSYKRGVCGTASFFTSDSFTPTEGRVL